MSFRPLEGTTAKTELAAGQLYQVICWSNDVGHAEAGLTVVARYGRAEHYTGGLTFKGKPAHLALIRPSQDVDMAEPVARLARVWPDAQIRAYGGGEALREADVAFQEHRAAMGAASTVIDGASAALDKFTNTMGAIAGAPASAATLIKVVAAAVIIGAGVYGLKLVKAGK